MSRGHLHQNSSLRRAIRAQTGTAAYPYQKYKPMPYQAEYNAYSGDESFDAKSAAITSAGDILGSTASAYISSKEETRRSKALSEVQRQIEMARIESEERSRMAEIAASIHAKTGGRGMTIALGVGALALLGGGTYFILRKRKKKGGSK